MAAIGDSFNVSVAQVRQHLEFLRAVHAAPGLQRRGAQLDNAVRRYALWLRTAVASGNAVVATPPSLDVAWLWHCHRLAPEAYVRDCLAAPSTGTTHCVPGPSPSAAFAFAPSGDEDGEPQWFAYDVAAAAARQGSFLWQVSGAAYADPAVLSGAVERYKVFLGALSADSAQLAPPLDVDLVWHTDMLRRGTLAYLEDTAKAVGFRVDHDDNIGSRDELAQLWDNTKLHWPENSGAGLVLNAPIQEGCERRCDAPAWWSDPTIDDVVVVDDFLSPSQIESIMTQMPAADQAAPTPGFGVDVRTIVDVDEDTSRRIVASVPHCGLDPDKVNLQGSLPARVAVGHMKPHRDRLAIDVGDDPMGASDPYKVLRDYADGYVAIVYLGGPGALRLQRDPGAAWLPDAWHHARPTERVIPIRPGRLIAWPNYAYTHSGASEDDPAGEADQPRWILGPVALMPGREGVVQSGDCGGGGGCKPRLPPPDPPTSSRKTAAELQGTFRSNSAKASKLVLRAENPDEFSAGGTCFWCCCFCNEHYMRTEPDGPFRANGGNSEGEITFHDNGNIHWTYIKKDMARDQPKGGQAMV